MGNRGDGLGGERMGGSGYGIRAMLLVFFGGLSDDDNDDEGNGSAGAKAP